MPFPDYIYTLNNKRSTSGYDKWAQDSYILDKFLRYKNLRTGKTQLFRIDENGFLPSTLAARNVFFSVPEYFVFCEKSELHANRITSYKNYKTELEQIKKKYPEYFL